MFDVVIRNGKIVDGSGQQAYVADVGVTGGRIEAILPDLALVDYFCSRVVVMYLGRVVEILPAEKVSAAPRHPYTKALADSVFVADPTARKDTAPIQGEVPSPFDLPPGCVFETRCPYAQKVCRETAPTLDEVGNGEYVACYFPLIKPHN